PLERVTQLGKVTKILFAAPVLQLGAPWQRPTQHSSTTTTTARSHLGTNIPAHHKPAWAIADKIRKSRSHVKHAREGGEPASILRRVRRLRRLHLRHCQDEVRFHISD